MDQGAFHRAVYLTGPTASGKTAVGVALARRLGAEIVAIDSMTIYRGMDIGTAKPTAAERAQVVHHLIDVVEPNQTFTVARFVEMADAIIRNAKVPLIATGGTPLYYKALFEGLFEGPPADEAIRERLRAERGYDYAVIGVGGFLTPDDYFAYREAGADAVQGATGAMWDHLLAVRVAVAMRDGLGD